MTRCLLLTADCADSQILVSRYLSTGSLRAWRTSIASFRVGLRYPVPMTYHVQVNEALHLKTLLVIII